MQIQEFFYWVASITLILIGIFTITLFALVLYLRKLADNTARNILTRVENISEQVGFATKTWRNLTLTRFVLRAIRLIF